MLKGLAICDLQPDGYRGVCRSNQLADYMTDAKIGGRVTDFLENFVDDESQEIRCTVAAACAARQMVDLLGSRGADCELITFNDEHEDLNDNVLFATEKTAQEVCAFMNYLSATYDNDFYCLSDYAVFAVFDGRDPA